MKKRFLVRGFTLIEILVAMAISLVILIGLYGTYILTSKTHRQSTNQEELAQNGRIALERISRDLRQTSKITTTMPIVETDLLNPPSTNIQFQDGHYTTKIRYLKYYLSGSDLRRQVIHYSFSAAPTVWVEASTLDQYNNPPTETIDEDLVKADKISQLKFWGTNVVNVQLTTLNNENSFVFNTTIFGRNI